MGASHTADPAGAGGSVPPASGAGAGLSSRSVPLDTHPGCQQRHSPASPVQKPSTPLPSSSESPSDTHLCTGHYMRWCPLPDGERDLTSPPTGRRTDTKVGQSRPSSLTARRQRMCDVTQPGEVTSHHPAALHRSAAGAGWSKEDQERHSRH